MLFSAVVIPKQAYLLLLCCVEIYAPRSNTCSLIRRRHYCRGRLGSLFSTPRCLRSCTRRSLKWSDLIASPDMKISKSLGKSIRQYLELPYEDELIVVVDTCCDFLLPSAVSHPFALVCLPLSTQGIRSRSLMRSFDSALPFPLTQGNLNE
jgi:hypothetical protein